jgi:hypothetical protein
MRLGKARVRCSGGVQVSYSCEIQVSRLGEIGFADRVKVTQVGCLDEFKKKIEETSPN